MNRKQRRELSKNKNMQKLLTKNLKKIKKDYDEKKDIFYLNDGEKVKLNIERILSRKIELDVKYIDFIKCNKDNILTVKNLDNLVHDIVTFKENDTWFFHISDLIKVENE